MKKDLMVVIKAFMFFTICFCLYLSVAFLIIYGTKILNVAIYILWGSLFFGLSSALYLFMGLLLFRKKLLFYSNMKNRMEELKIKTVHFESVVGDTTSRRIKYGGLFLTDDAVIFITHRFSMKPSIIILPLDKIVTVKKAGINLYKIFAGGLKARLQIISRDGQQNEFSAWNIDEWIAAISNKIGNSK